MHKLTNHHILAVFDTSLPCDTMLKLDNRGAVVISNLYLVVTIELLAWAIAFIIERERIAEIVSYREMCNRREED